MKIINITKNTVISEDAVLADVPFKRMKGLLGKKYLGKSEALILKPCNSVHTFFMRFPIDVLFLDKNNRVVKAINSLKPFRVTPIYFTATLAIELPIGTIQGTSTRQDDILQLIAP